MHRSSQPPTPANLPARLPLGLLAPHTRQLREIELLAGVPKAHWRAYYFDALLAYARVRPATASFRGPSSL